MSHPMVYRRFGKTEIQMPVLTCGGMRFQQAWQDIELDEITDESTENIRRTILRALELGINHIETARGYGCSERQLGQVLPDFDRDALVVQTKVGPQEHGDDFLRTFDVSMERLRLEYVDLLSLHGINNREILDMALRPGGCLEAARRLQDEGRVRHVGFSTHGTAAEVLDAVRSDAFDYVNLHWYYVDPSATPAIDAARKRDMGVFIISPNDKGGKLYAPSERLVELCAPLTPMGFNDLFCLARPDVHTLSIGAAGPGDFDAHMDILPCLDTAAETIAPILERLDQAVVEALGESWAGGWSRGLPQWDQVPGDVNLYHILRLYTCWKAFDLLDYGRMRYNLLGNGGHWFPGTKVDQLDWEKLQDCLRDNPVAEAIPGALREAHNAFDAEAVKRLSESEA